MATETTKVIQSESPELEAYKLALLKQARELTNQGIDLPLQQVAGLSPLELEAMDGVTERVGKAWDEGDGYSGAIKDVGTEIFDTMKESLSEVYGDIWG